MATEFGLALNGFEPTNRENKTQKTSTYIHKNGETKNIKRKFSTTLSSKVIEK